MPSDPCAPSVVGRKYDAKEPALASEVAAQKQKSSMMPAWAFSLFGVTSLVTFSFAAGFYAIRVHFGQRVELVPQSEEFDEEAYILSNDGLCE